MPQFLGPHMRATGGEVTDSQDMALAALHHSLGMKIPGDGVSFSEAECIPFSSYLTTLYLFFSNALGCKEFMAMEEKVL